MGRFPIGETKSLNPRNGRNGYGNFIGKFSKRLLNHSNEDSGSKIKWNGYFRSEFFERFGITREVVVLRKIGPWKLPEMLTRMCPRKESAHFTSNCLMHLSCVIDVMLQFFKVIKKKKKNSFAWTWMESSKSGISLSLLLCPSSQWLCLHQTKCVCFPHLNISLENWKQEEALLNVK